MVKQGTPQHSDSVKIPDIRLNNFPETSTHCFILNILRQGLCAIFMCNSIYVVNAGVLIDLQSTNQVGMIAPGSGEIVIELMFLFTCTCGYIVH